MSSPPLPPSSDDQVNTREVRALVQRFGLNPTQVAKELLDERRQLVEATKQLGKVLEDLLQPGPILRHLAYLIKPNSGAPAQAVVTMNGQLQELPIHPSVNLDELARLNPWEFVAVNPKELLVVGTRTDACLKEQCKGAIGEFRGYEDRERGLVRVARPGREEELVILAPHLRHEPLTVESRLVLQRGREEYAIDQVSNLPSAFRYEVPLEQMTTKLSDLAGLEAVVEPLLEDLLLRLVRPDIGRRFDQDPLRGMILYSYKPGMGKSALIRALCRWLREQGEKLGFDVVLYSVKPNELKSKWHGQDAQNVREFFAQIRARLAQSRSRPLLQLVLFDEADSLGTRSGNVHALSSAHNDVVQALLAEMDGLVPLTGQGGAPANVFYIALTNRPEMLDPALKRPERFGLILPMPDYTIEGAEDILWVYSRSADIPWYLDGDVRYGVPENEIRQRLLRPALARVFPATVLHYLTDGQRKVVVSAGAVLAGVNYKNAMNRAKRKAAVRQLRNVGVPAIGFDDLMDGLIEESCTVAGQFQTDPTMLKQVLQLPVPVVRVEPVPETELAAQHRYLRIVS